LLAASCWVRKGRRTPTARWWGEKRQGSRATPQTGDLKPKLVLRFPATPVPCLKLLSPRQFRATDTPQTALVLLRDFYSMAVICCCNATYDCCLATAMGPVLG